VHLEPAARERLDDVVRDARRIRFLTSRTKQHDFRRAVCMLALYSIDETRTTRDLPLQALHITAGYALLRMLAQVPDDPVDDESAHA
jgi:phytoene/squalene synthetase